MSIDQLKVLASICEDEFVSKGTVIFKEGEPGGVVYVVVNGRIGIERDDKQNDLVVRLATLEARSSFGEMNMFDNSPRSADAIAIEDSLLLKLRAEPFGALIRQQPDMSLELIKVLSMRIREANDQIARLTRSMPRQLQKLYDKLDDPNQDATQQSIQ
jgi:CRP-like cAMP-binding protein